MNHIHNAIQNAGTLQFIIAVLLLSIYGTAILCILKLRDRELDTLNLTARILVIFLVSKYRTLHKQMLINAVLSSLALIGGWVIVAEVLAINAMVFAPLYYQVLRNSLDSRLVTDIIITACRHK